MSVTISQSLTIPANVATGGTIQASDITTLYNAMNAFVIPNTALGFLLNLSDNALYSVATGATKDWSLTSTIAQTQSTLFMTSMSWTGGANPTFQLRLNATAITGCTITMSGGAAGSGLIFGYIGGHDTTDVPRGVVLLGVDTGSTTLRTAVATADLADASWTQLGYAVGAAGVTAKLKYMKVLSTAS